MEEEFSKFQQEIRDKLNVYEGRLERGLDRLNSAVDNIRISATGAETTANSFAPRGSHVLPGASPELAVGNTDIQGDFAALKDSLVRIKLPSELKLNESRQGIKRADQPVLNVLTKCSRYSETLAKLLSTIEPGQEITQETLESLFLICQAQAKYLQDEYAVILVNSQFDSSTSRLFRALQKNTSGLNPESLGTLRSAAQISASSRPAERGGQQSYRGRGRGGYQRGRDVFNSFSHRGFPKSRWNRGDDNNAASQKDE